MVIYFRNSPNCLKKPYDYRIFDAMLLTTIDLVYEFNASTGFTQSDEISIIFPPLRKKSPQDDNKQMKYEGRCQKISTLMSGYCSVRFLANLLKVVEKNPDGLVIEDLKKKKCTKHVLMQERFLCLMKRK